MTADQRALASPPAPNPMGHDRFQIIEKRLVQPDENTPPTLVAVHTGAWQLF
jgi:hypothetical protein